MKNIEFEKEGLKKLFEVSRSNHINCSFYLYVDNIKIFVSDNFLVVYNRFMSLDENDIFHATLEVYTYYPSNFCVDQFLLLEYGPTPEEPCEMVETNHGAIPYEDCLDIMAMQYFGCNSYEEYEEAIKNGYFDDIRKESDYE